ncbi:hypothetical protein A5784_35020 [Mycobacterium sp. 852013-50091_SCH5140682]|uniref:hypothetical protein n=1 Tax=Mycobacterium sp. 852013-50091_SCH5140682 TaxID=1834109 RepID=UPI0007EB6EF9|nr:hypothetical protein [Mycobacterium sp. 852013-50091_SCH5140682]OBC11412.1 hypothetical protein A5784_35020 [Mycobacterium sp. 852013-50091_SCH5140682]
MSDRIEAVIAEALRIDADDAPDSWSQKVWPHRARVVLAALKAARIAVVELPDPVLHPRHQERVWEVGDSHVIFSEKWGDIRADLDYDNGDDDPLKPSDAEAFAAALLAAAADAAGASQ